MSHSINEVCAALSNGAVVILPTETVYGLAVIESQSDKLYEIKSRPMAKLLAKVYSSVDQVLSRVNSDQYVEMAIRRLLPGPFTIIVNFANGEKTGVRVPDHPLCCEVLSRIESDVVLTSANIHNEFPAMSFDQAQRIFPDLIGLDGGLPKYCRPSMIVDLTSVR